MTNNNNIAYLIVEEAIEPQTPTILNAPKKDKMVQIKTSLQDVEQWNRNARYYGKKDLMEGLMSPHITELINAKSWVGEAGHPLNADLKRQMSIVNSNVSHRINKWWFEGNTLKGIVEAMNGGTGSMGVMFHNFILQEMKVAFSLRAVGPIQKTPNGDIVKSPIRICGYDWIYLPSHKVAYQDEIINTVSERTNNTSSIINESLIVPLLESQAISYVKEESKNLKYVSELFEFCYDNISLSEDKSKIILTEGTNKLHVSIEKDLTRDICNEYLRNFKKFH